MIKRLLIANRGEIACRILKRPMPWVSKPSPSIPMRIIGHGTPNSQRKPFILAQAPHRDSYLDIAKVLDIARQEQVDAIHPGYGFLSENTSFAEACADNNIRFIGPPASAYSCHGL